MVVSTHYISIKTRAETMAFILDEACSKTVFDGVAVGHFLRSRLG
jgi:hypothetical protein